MKDSSNTDENSGNSKLSGDSEDILGLEGFSNLGIYSGSPDSIIIYDALRRVLFGPSYSSEEKPNWDLLLSFIIIGSIASVFIRSMDEFPGTFLTPINYDIFFRSLRSLIFQQHPNLIDDQLWELLTSYIREARPFLSIGLNSRFFFRHTILGFLEDIIDTAKKLLNFRDRNLKPSEFLDFYENDFKLMDEKDSSFRRGLKKDFKRLSETPFYNFVILAGQNLFLVYFDFISSMPNVTDEFRRFLFRALMNQSKKMISQFMWGFIGDVFKHGRIEDNRPDDSF